MTRALFAKQMQESFSWVYFNRKTGKKRTGAQLVLFVGLYLFLFGYLGFFFYLIAGMMCAPFTAMGYRWLYIALMGLLSLVLGVFGSVFNTYASLYRAKDNDLLLSLPVRPSQILAVRLSGVYLMGLLYESIVMIPTLIVFFRDSSPSFLGGLFALLIPFVLSLFVLTLSCLLGFVVAVIAAKIKHKNAATLIVSLLFLGGYFYFYTTAYNALGDLLADPSRLAGGVKGVLYPLYHMGLAAEGKVLSMLIFCAIFGAAFALTCVVLSKSFLHLATANRGNARVTYRAKRARCKSLSGALLRKEFLRFLGSPIYMLNCALGTLFMPIGAVVLFVKGGEWVSAFQPLLGEGKDLLCLVATAMLCMLGMMNDITAPSVSLEGKNLWVVQSLPIPMREVLYAKLKLHLLLTVLPLLLPTAAILIVFRPTWTYWVLVPAVALLSVVLAALWGLFLGLKMPNLKWNSETTVVKQSMSVMLALFGGWGFVGILVGAYLLLDAWISPLLFLLLSAVLMCALSVPLFFWIRTRGEKILTTL